MTVTEAMETASERLARLREWDDIGMPRTEMAKREGISRQRIAELLGPRKERKPRKERRMYVSDEAFDRFLEIAKQWGLTLRSNNGKEPEGSPGKLVEQIGMGQLKVVRADEVRKGLDKTRL